jgi:plastocyanin
MRLEQRNTALSTTAGAVVVIAVILVAGLVIYAENRTTTPSVLSSSSASVNSSLTSALSSCSSAGVPAYGCTSTVSSISTNSTTSCVPSAAYLCTSSSTNSSSSTSALGAVVTIPKGTGVGPSAAPGYSPDTITVVIGINNTVTWTNNDTVDHTVASSSVSAGAANFTSPLIAPAGTYTYTFTVPGTYSYYCTLHAWMTGTVIVKAASSPPAA